MEMASYQENIGALEIPEGNDASDPMVGLAERRGSLTSAPSVGCSATTRQHAD
ncbi:uncharacterized protein PHALS_07391 [Plasmopara halstedii]|uniref:Uncharacterized protein n=1 Tax=Plasmopara halstedii TaxID=4781 RepID=A0A0P1B4F5_PLAHL|nr:uncharacterized protein PHALS_07391 [Plasmopara halstedii]CEG49638.1 hypothetical protein PHALS_07391 [Plasmopara halstedii]|eukprot:XP_024586007.1 hypothetical protein PHALS_07391 [Plasmopara halstedii]